MTACPLRNEDPRHKVELDAAQTPEREENTQEVDEWGDWKDPNAGKPLLSTETPEVAVEDVDLIQNEEMRRRALGLNLVYHGRSTEGSGVAGISYLVTDIERGISEKLPPSDPRAYQGEAGALTPYIYAPTQRLVKAIINNLQKNPVLREKYPEVVEVLTDWGQQLMEASMRMSKSFRGFCKT